MYLASTGSQALDTVLSIVTGLHAGTIGQYRLVSRRGQRFFFSQGSDQPPVRCVSGILSVGEVAKVWS